VRVTAPTVELVNRPSASYANVSPPRWVRRSAALQVNVRAPSEVRRFEVSYALVALGPVRLAIFEPASRLKDSATGPRIEVRRLSPQ
jgi:hypothetical protein